MKRNKILALILALTAILAIALTGCGEESNGTEWVDKTFGDITISLPEEFQDVNQSNGVYTCAGPGASVTVSEATPADIGPEDWTQELLEDNLGIMYGATYTDISLLSFEGNVDINGDPAVCFDLQGTNSSGKVRIIRNVYLFNDEAGEQYVIALIYTDGDSFFSDEVCDTILASITRN